MTVFCLAEVEDGVVADVSLRALTLARGLPGALAAVVFAPPSGSVPPSVLADLAAYGVSDVYAVSGTGGYAPQAWARALADLAAGAAGAAVVLAAGTDRGNEVLAHVGAITGLPMAANCVAVAAVDAAPGVASAAAHEIVRQRWAGLLLEEAVLEAPAGAADGGHRRGASPPRRGTGPGCCPSGHAVAGRGRPGGARRRNARGHGRRVAGQRPGGRRRRPRGRQRGRIRSA